jgi:sterol desaturase/sphingolipid hydroxylase (fatty acid hydroxylase superfamily)
MDTDGAHDPEIAGGAVRPGSSGDRLTAPRDAVPRRRAEVLTLSDCWRSFVRRPSPRLLAGAITAALATRAVLGNFDWRDAVVAGGLVAVTPLVEWLIHVYVLHAKPLRLRGRRYELFGAPEHRAHHQAPSELDGVLIPPFAVLVFLAEIALAIWLTSFPIHVVLGGERLAHAATGLLVGYLILGGYEWCHFLIHTPNRPRGRYYRSIWRGHRLHHYKNEHYWFGVTSTIGDHLLGTAPDHADVATSGTARSLGADVV